MGTMQQKMLTFSARILIWVGVGGDYPQRDKNWFLGGAKKHLQYYND